MSKLAVFTLASNDDRCLINPDNIALVMKMDGENEDQSVTFSRVFLKALTIPSDEKWVDVKETVDEIRRKCK